MQLRHLANTLVITAIDFPFCVVLTLANRPTASQAERIADVDSCSGDKLLCCCGELNTIITVEWTAMRLVIVIFIRRQQR